MKKIIFLLLCFMCAAATAQTIPPRFHGLASEKLFREALEERVIRVYERDDYTFDDLTPDFWLTFTIDTLGRCVDLEIPDTCGCRKILVKERTVELLRTALAEMDSFQPAKEKGRKVPYEQEISYDFRFIPGAFVMPTFNEKDADDINGFALFAARRVVYPDRLAAKNISGRVIIKFYVNRDGSVTLGDVVESPDLELTRQVQALVRGTSGKWSPGMYLGVPIRQSILLPIDFRL